MKKFGILVVALVAVLSICLCACAKSSGQQDISEAQTDGHSESQSEEQAENSGVQGGNFAEIGELNASLNATGNTTVTLTQDETADLTGIQLDGRKEVLLNNFTLTLTGQYGVTQKAVLDIKPGEGFTEGVIDMSALKFDLSNAPTGDMPELALLEIRPGITIVEPQYDSGIVKREFPGMMTVIEYIPVN